MRFLEDAKASWKGRQGFGKVLAPQSKQMSIGCLAGESFAAIAAAVVAEVKKERDLLI